jgi:MFS family permease
VSERPAVRSHNVTLAALLAAGLTFSFQQTLVLPALPRLQHELHASTAWVTWVLTGFLLSSAVATPLLGKLGDQYGKGRLLTISLALLLLGSFGAIFAWNIWSLIGFRALQGLGGGVFPLAYAIIKDEFPPDRVGSGVGIMASMLAVGGGCGLVLSGIIVDHLSWRYLFILGTIGVAVAALLVHRFVPESPIRTRARLDVAGAALLSVGLIANLVALTEGDRWGWLSGRTLGFFAAGLLILIVWMRVELRRAEPMIDMRTMRERAVLLTNLTSFLIGLAAFGVWVMIPIFVQTPNGLSNRVAHLVTYGFGASATDTGLYLLPGSVLGVVMAAASGRIWQRFGPKWPLAGSLASVATGLALLGVWHDHPWQIVSLMVVVGGVLPMAFAAMATIIVHTVPPGETGVATGVHTVIRMVGNTVGGQVCAAILAAGAIAGTHVPSESAFDNAFWVGAAVGGVAAGAALLITPRRSRRRAYALAEA